ncbi:MAG: hypothetical protein KatS3mg043_1395 [Rhodothermaceae bacterium]|nr:MAG: hypothetical protein KatS3mg043_1395 [Rhodothermaceae bacterium]
MQPPNLSRLAVYEQGFQKGLYEDLVRIAESEFPEGSFSFWLTIQRFVGQALEALGAPYAPVAEAVKLELALLLRRVPVLTTLAFADGTPFADPLTVEWVETQVRPLLGSGDGGGAATAAEDHLERLFQEARKKLGTGDLKAALAVMQQEADRDTSDAHRFRRRLYVALLCLRGGQPGVARSTLESLDQQIAHHALDAWDPALALEVWSNLYTCYATLARTPDGEQAGFQEKARQTLDKISRLDVGYALSLLGKK